MITGQSVQRTAAVSLSVGVANPTPISDVTAGGGDAGVNVTVFSQLLIVGKGCMDNELLEAVQNVFDGTHVSCLCAHFKQRMFQNFLLFFFFT